MATVAAAVAEVVVAVQVALFRTTHTHTHTHICTLYMYERGKHYGGVRKSNSLAREVPGLWD